MGIRRLSNRALARGIKRSEKYVRERVNDEQEWRIADLERMCELWRMTFGQLTSYVDFKADHSHPEATGADSISSYQSSRSWMVMISFKSSTDRHPRHSSTTKKDGQYGNIARQPKSNPGTQVRMPLGRTPSPMRSASVSFWRNYVGVTCPWRRTRIRISSRKWKAVTAASDDCLPWA